MLWRELAIGVCLMLVLEGVMPFLSPEGWRRMVLGVAGLSDQHLRLVGFASMLIGTLALYLIN